jgi:hypothetical protein
MFVFQGSEYAPVSKGKHQLDEMKALLRGEIQVLYDTLKSKGLEHQYFEKSRFDR